MALKGILSRIHPEGIPYPFTRLYSFFTTRRLFTDFYEQVARDIVKRFPSSRILDIGTGPGKLPVAIALKSKYAHITGIDLSEDMVRIAQKYADEKGVDNVSFKKGDAGDLPFRDHEFDLVVSTLSFHHWKEVDRAFDEIFRVLREGGEAWIYDIPRRIDPVRFQALKKKYGFVTATLFKYHSFTEPFYDEATIAEIASRSRFHRYYIDLVGIAYRLRLYR